MLEDIEEDRLSIMKSTVPSHKDNKMLISNASTKSKSRGEGLSQSGDKRNKAMNATGDGISIRSSSQQSVRPLPPMPRTGAFETMAKTASTVSLNTSQKQFGGSCGMQEVETVDEKGCFSFLKCCGGQKNQVSGGDEMNF